MLYLLDMIVCCNLKKSIGVSHKPLNNNNYSKNFYSTTYSAGQQHFTSKRAEAKTQYKIQSKYDSKVYKVK